MKTLFVLCLLGSLFGKPAAESETGPFTFVVSDIFKLSTGQLVVSGQITSGEIRINEQLRIPINSTEVTVAIEKMEIFGRTDNLDVGFKDDYVAFTISGVQRGKLWPGMVLTK